MPDHPLLVVLIAVAVWWLSTGLVLFGVRRGEGASDSGTILTTGWALLLLVSGFALLLHSGSALSPTGAYAGFFGALLIWAGHEVTFLTGMLTGPRGTPCPPGLSGWRRFKAAFETVSTHEYLILLTAAAIVLLMHDAGNRFGMWTFLLLWGMRISAKLNIFFGAPNAISDLMPARLDYLTSYFNTEHTSHLFPVAIGIASSIMVALVIGAFQAPHDFVFVGHLLLATFMGLAIIEHFVLVLPVSDRALWAWALPDRATLTKRTPNSPSNQGVNPHHENHI